MATGSRLRELSSSITVSIICSQVQSMERSSLRLFSFQISTDLSFDLFCSASVTNVFFTTLFSFVLYKTTPRPSIPVTGRLYFQLPSEPSSYRKLVCLCKTNSTALRKCCICGLKVWGSYIQQEKFCISVTSHV
jgi:hypothetical protein